MRWTSLACITVAIQLLRVRRWHRARSSSSTAARRSTSYVGSALPAAATTTMRRALGRHMGKYIPGNPSIVCRTCRARAATRRPATSTRLRPGTAPPSACCFPAASSRRCSPTRRSSTIRRNSSIVGSANSDVYTCVVRTDTPIKSFKDAFTQEVIVGASNEGGTTRDMPTLSNNVLGSKFRIVTGYAGTREMALAVERTRDRTGFAASATPACCR